VKIRIEAAPGELEARIDEALASVLELAGGALVKASPLPAADHGDEGPRPFAEPVLQAALERATKQSARIQRIMQRKIAEVIRASSDR
jgi:hypothetical protein